ncbi:DUF397 domain-containing protein [Streptomyces sp. NPDC002536]
MSAEPTWFKSSYSGPEGSQCVEVAPLPFTVHVRDSARRNGPQLAIGAHAWAAFITYASGA